MDILSSIPYILWVHRQGMTSLKHNQYTGVLLTQPLNTQAVRQKMVRTTKAPCHPQVGVCCYINNHMPWICYHSFCMFCGCMDKVLHTYDIINTLGSCATALINPRVGVYC